MTDTYKCAACGGVFNKVRSDKEAIAETRANFSDHYADNIEETCDVVCDDCYKQFYAWLERREQRELGE